MTEQADRDLLDGIRAGRREDCARLIHDHYQAIYRFLLHLTRCEAEAEDLTQETFAAAWEKIGAFEGRSTLRTWLHRIAYGKFVDGRRAGRRSAALMEGLKERGAAAASQARWKRRRATTRRGNYTPPWNRSIRRIAYCWCCTTYKV